MSEASDSVRLRPDRRFTMHANIQAIVPVVIPSIAFLLAGRFTAVAEEPIWDSYGIRRAPLPGSGCGEITPFWVGKGRGLAYGVGSGLNLARASPLLKDNDQGYHFGSIAIFETPKRPGATRLLGYSGHHLLTHEN